MYLAPGFPLPPNSDDKGYHGYVDECLPTESPYLYGLHPNAEIEFLTSTSEILFRTVFEMQPRDVGSAGSAGTSREEKVKNLTLNKRKRKIFLNDNLHIAIMKLTPMFMWLSVVQLV